MSTLGDASDIAQALEQDPSDGAGATCWCALGRVVDDEPTYVFDEGDANGMSVGVMVLTGPFTGAEVRAMVSGPLGVGAEFRPISPGQRVLVHFLEGTVDGLAVAVASVPGGRENPLPKVVAGVDVKSALDPTPQVEGDSTRAILFAPPKRIGHREYYRGAIKVTRLKGKENGFFSGWVISADDGAEVSLTWNGAPEASGGQAYGFRVKDAKGAVLQVVGGAVAMVSPDGKSRVEVSNDGVLISSAKPVKVFGSPVTINHGPKDGVPNPTNGGVVVAKVPGAIAGVASISTSVFIGDAP